MTGDFAAHGAEPWWRRSLREWFSWRPMRHAAWETFLFRLGIAWIAWLTIGGASHKSAQPVPHGMAAWGVDFTWLGDSHLAQWLVPLWAVCLLLYVLSGIPLTRPIWWLMVRVTATTPRGLVAMLFVPRLFAWVAFPICWLVERLTWVFPPVLILLPPLIASFGHGTLGNSSGAIGHTTQLVTLVLLASWLAALWSTVCEWRGKSLPNDFTPSQLAADWTRQVFMSTYVVSAISKLIQSHGLWFQDAPYFGLQIVKALGMAKYGDYGQGNDVEWLAQFMLDHAWLSKLLIGVALPLELFAFLAVLNRRLSLVFGILLYLFHSTVTEVLHLGFVYHKALLLILMVNPLWWLVQGMRRLTGSRTLISEH